MLAPAGTEGAPSHAFKTDPDTGFYSIAANVLGLSVGGTLRQRVEDWAFIDKMPRIAKVGTPTSRTTSATLSAAHLFQGAILVNQGAGGASAQQLPTVSDLNTYLGSGVGTGNGFDFYVINTSVVAAEDASITTNTGWTLVGEMTVEANDDDRARSSGHFRAEKTLTGWTLYRLA